MVAARILVLAAGMLLTGSLNTIATKYQVRLPGLPAAGVKVPCGHMEP